MKILLATDLYKPAVNGVVTSTVSLKRSLENLGHEVRVLTLSEIDYIDMDQDVYAISSMNVNKIYPGARVRFFRDRSIIKEIIHWKPDIIHTQSEFRSEERRVGKECRCRCWSERSKRKSNNTASRGE